LYHRLVETKGMVSHREAGASERTVRIVLEIIEPQDAVSFLSVATVL
jgi:hypothetical protein